MLIRRERPQAQPDLAETLRATLAAYWSGLAPGTPMTVTLPLPNVTLTGLPAPLPALWYWAKPKSEEHRLATGTALRLEASGPRRLLDLAERLAALRAVWLSVDPTGSDRSPALCLDLDFAATQPARLTLPLLAVESSRAGTFVTFAAVVDGRDAEQVRTNWMQALRQVLAALHQPPAPVRVLRLTRSGETPSRADWERRAASAVQDIQAGRLEKVVLTRTLSVVADAEISLSRLIHRLAERHSGCAILAMERPDGILVAATPERLAKLRGGRVVSDALAGTCRREGEGPEEGDALRANLKERHEHRLVVEWITAGLTDVCTALSLPEAPRIMTLPRLLHLWTPIRGRLRAGRGVLDVLHRLHPTPAVAGLPVEAALAWLEQHGETRPAGYTGAAGWLDLNGDGEMHVVLRAALLREASADLYAGAGIVAQSDPRAEFAETELKLRTLLEALADG